MDDFYSNELYYLDIYIVDIVLNISSHLNFLWVMYYYLCYTDKESEVFRGQTGVETHLDLTLKMHFVCYLYFTTFIFSVFLIFSVNIIRTIG